MAAALLTVVAGRSVAGQGGVGNESDLLLRSAFELNALRGLLADPEAWEILRQLSVRYSPWRISTWSPGESACERPADLPPGEPHAFAQSFIFSGRRGLSSRAYRVEFESCRDRGGDLRHTASSAGFISQKQEPQTQEVPGPVVLEIVRAAVGDDGVRSDLAAVLETSSVSFVRFTLSDASAAGGATTRVYLLEFGTHAGAGGVPAVLLRYEVLYDEQAGKVLEILPAP